MPSIDFSREPILILTRKEAQALVSSSCFSPYIRPELKGEAAVWAKVRQFLEETKVE